MDVAFAADIAYAMAPGSGSGGGGMRDLLATLPLFLGMALIMYFVMYRPQQKSRQERERMLSALKRGDRVVTTSGLHATVTGLSEHTVTLRVADQVRLEFDRSAVGRVVEAPGGDKDA
jgi:preprotein translocase subunit YajC